MICDYISSLVSIRIEINTEELKPIVYRMALIAMGILGAPFILCPYVMHKNNPQYVTALDGQVRKEKWRRYIISTVSAISLGFLIKGILNRFLISFCSNGVANEQRSEK